MNVAVGLIFDIGVRHANHLLNPVLIDRSVATVAGQKRNCHTRNASQHDFVDGFFQHVQTRHANNRIDMAANDDLQNDR